MIKGNIFILYSLKHSIAFLFASAKLVANAIEKHHNSPHPAVLCCTHHFDPGVTWQVLLNN